MSNGMRAFEANGEMLQRFGFNIGMGSAHTARTMMLSELESLLSYVNSVDATRDTYIEAIVDSNCLGKRSGRTRQLTARHLVELYSLDSETTIFRSMLEFWERDREGQPLLALLCAYARDSLLRLSAPFILSLEEGQAVSTEDMEEFIEDKVPGRFSNATLKSLSQNINSTWTQSGHLSGKAKKIRKKAKATQGSVAFALFLGFLCSVQGKPLFETEYVKVLDCSTSLALELAEEAASRGSLVMKRIGDIIEIQFPSLLTNEEMGWLHEPY